jgi:hypothetical protein
LPRLTGQLRLAPGITGGTLQFRGQHALQACADEEGGLGAESQHLEIRAVGGLCDTGEIDPGRDVLHPHVHERIVVGAMPEVAAKRAPGAIGVIELGARQSVIDEQRHAAFELSGERRHPRLKGQADFRLVVVRQRRGQCAQHVPHRAGELGAGLGLAPLESVRRKAHTQRAHLLSCRVVTAQDEPLHRHGVQHFVGQHHAVHRRIGPTLQPLHPRCKLARQSGNTRPLTFGEIGADFENEIAPRQDAQLGQAGEHVGRHAARTGAQLEHVAADGVQHFGGLVRQAAREQARQLRRSDEVASGAQLGGAGAVVAEPRRIQRQPHPGIEADDAAVRGHEAADVFHDTTRMRVFFGGQWRQGCDGCGEGHTVRA